MSQSARKLLTEEQRLVVRHQALADLYVLQWTLEMSLGTWEAPRRYLTSVRNRSRLNRSLDLLQQAGEDVPRWLYQQGPLYPGALRNSKTGRPIGAFSLASLLGTITEVRQLFNADLEAAPPQRESP